MSDPPLIRSLLFLVISALSLLPAHWHQADADPRRPDDAYDFAVAFVESLSWADQAQETVRKTPESDTAFPLAVQLKIAAGEYAQAAQIIETFKKSKNGIISVAASSIHSAYTLLQEIHRRTATALVEIRGSSDLPRAMDRLSDLMASNNQALKMLAYAAVSVTYALVQLPDNPNPDQPIGNRLAVTGSQRHDLLRRLERIFGKPVKDGLKVGQPPILAAGATIYGFLADTRWKALDE